MYRRHRKRVPATKAKRTKSGIFVAIEASSSPVARLIKPSGPIGHHEAALVLGAAWALVKNRALPSVLPSHSPTAEATMIDHTGIGVSDIARSAAFYDAVLGALGMRRIMQMPDGKGTDGIGYGEAFP